MSKQINEIDISENKVLTAIVRSFGAALFDLNSFQGLKFEAVFAQSELKLALLNLCKKNWIISMRKIAGERVYCVPYDAYIKHMTEISSGLLHQLTPLDNVEEDGQSTVQDLVMDMIIIMRWIGIEQPKLSKKGQLDKKLIERMLQHIRLTPDRLAEHVGNGAMKLSFPLSISVLIDLGLRLGTIHIVDGHLRLNQQRVEQWLELNPIDVKLQLYHLWFSVHYPELHFKRQFLILLPMLPSDQWFSIDNLFRYMDDLDQHHMNTYLLAVQELGWVQLGQTLEGIQAVRSLIGIDNEINNISSYEDRWFVQPDFEIIVPLRVNYSDHYKLNTYATLISRNRMVTYLITKDSMFAAFQQGWIIEEVLKHLESLARYGVPESIRISLVEWDTQYRGVNLETVVILRCESIVIAEELMTIPAMSMTLNEQNRIAPQIFLIPKKDVDFIHKMMNTYGYRTDKKGNNNRTNTHIDNELEPSTGIFHSRIRYDMYTVDEQHPNIESLYPGLADVPSGWMNTYVPYHMSTRKQLLQQAIDWQCYVQVAIEGEDMIIVPLSLILEDAIPKVECMFRGNMIQTELDKLVVMRLIVPGIHNETKYMSTID